MVSAKEEEQLNRAIQDSILTAAMDMRSPPDPPKSHHRLDTEPIARNEDYTTTFTETSRLTAYQRSQSMSAAEYQQRSSIERFKMHFTDAELNSGDTLIFVDFPELTKGFKIPVDCDGKQFRSKSLRVRSQNLLATGSSRFREMLKPSYQFRVLRRRKLVNKLPEGVKYVLDLTPPSEGDEVVFQITELSLTPGIIKWWSSYARLDVPYFLVKGHDDVCPCKQLADRSVTDPKTETISVKESGDNSGSQQTSVVTLPLSALELVSARNGGEKLQVAEVPAHFAIKDYCPIRHRNGIIRLLMLIERKQVFINSAPRLWTMVALAKIWDCVSVVQDPAIQWLMQGKNSKFLEILPEETIRIGGILENPQITRTAFRILVNELAFEQTASDEMKDGIDLTRVTLFGRRKGDPGDEFSNLIQHAALAFVERKTRLLTELQSPGILKEWKIPEYLELLKLEESLKCSALNLCKPALKLVESLKVQLQTVLASDIIGPSRLHNLFTSMEQNTVDSDRATYVEPPDFREFANVCQNMTPLQTLLTPYPYKRLKNSWEAWADIKNRKGDNSYGSLTEVTQVIAKEMGRLRECHKYLPWENELRPRLSEVLSEFSVQHHVPFYPLSLERLDVQVRSKLEELGGKILDNEQDLWTVSTKHFLLSLTSNETKFLPLWAGGLNDGTGGVFEDQLPPAEMGPDGPGPSYHTGITIASDASSMSGSLSERMWALSMRGSLTAASMEVRDSASTVYRPEKVIADDKSVLSESFHSDLADFHEARGEDAAVIIDAPEQRTQQDTLSSLDDFLQEPDGDYDSDSTSTISNDDFDLLLDCEDDMYTNELDTEIDVILI
ncbi:hypothetical protein ISF_05477 [Cordyceps fumosorosea ARSEF 2679]|uniref:Uncharacterized protein n=1 Tax=Cordyceps fumosorosea (strain ARSEF 2679) TaxID=1081104 RepID=A0A167UAY1_CORFA|nr:hypothetical protein ISF_05477 [Cordyceps fumosorosea ARSEF 2679]OAA61398.1 hypothetical protein ISF_05477 [Cordyceps fumosorosea ARSEF 2679]